MDTTIFLYLLIYISIYINIYTGGRPCPLPRLHHRHLLLRGVPRRGLGQVRNIYTISTQYLHNIYTISTRYLNNIYSYHARECGLLALLVAAALNNFCLLSVRALARYSLSRVLELAASLDRCGYLDTRVDNIYNIYTAQARH